MPYFSTALIVERTSPRLLSPVCKAPRWRAHNPDWESPRCFVQPQVFVPDNSPESLSSASFHSSDPWQRIPQSLPILLRSLESKYVFRFVREEKPEACPDHGAYTDVKACSGLEVAERSEGMSGVAAGYIWRVNEWSVHEVGVGG